MGASGSLLGSRHSRARVNCTNRFNLSSLLCGSSTSRAIYEMENHPVEDQADSTEVLVPAIIGVCKVSEESSIACCAGPRDGISTAETGISSRRNLEDNTVEEGTRNIACFNERKNLSESKELVSPHRVSAHHSYDESSSVSSSTISSSCVGQSSAPVSTNVFANKDVVNGINNSVDNDVSQILSEVVHPSSSSLQGLGDSSSGLISAESHIGGVVAVQNSEPDPVGPVSNSPVTSQILRHESSEGTTPSGLGLLVSNRERGQTDGNLLHVDVVTISTNILPSSNNDTRNHEARRNGRRLFWDAFSRRSSRRHGDSPTVVFTADEIDNPSSRDRWLVDLTGDIFGNGNGDDSGHLDDRIHRLNEQRQHSRSEIWERLRGGLDDINRWNYSCPLGLHPDGACSCEGNPFMEEASTRANISRIVMLAEALFEVLDEIHHQPASLSLSMVSVPAPESIVDSFPLKEHIKVEPSNSGDDVEQCYICLADYEEGDKIRVLPCQHEYHMACVDKWLKEIHGVCPLCRGDVCEGLRDSAASNALVPSPLH